nr:hypothetical protein GCM10020241_33020 [Streptoalloteichus tenebrarius]
MGAGGDVSNIVAWLSIHGATLVWLLVALVGVAVLYKIATLLRAAGEVVRAVVWVLAAPFVGAWWAGKGLWWLGRQARRFWRTSLGFVGAGGLVLLVGVPPAGVLATLALVAGIAGWCWWFAWRESFTHYMAGPLRGWWRRWAVYAPRWDRWMRRLDLVVRDVVAETSEGVQTVAAVAVPRLVWVRSDPWWDTLRVALAVGQAPGGCHRQDLPSAGRAALGPGPGAGTGTGCGRYRGATPGPAGHHDPGPADPGRGRGPGGPEDGHHWADGVR